MGAQQVLGKFWEEAILAGSSAAICGLMSPRRIQGVGLNQLFWNLPDTAKQVSSEFVT